MDELRPWSDPRILARVLARWRQLYAGRDLFRISAGPGWLRLHLTGDERPGLLLSDVPGARLVCRSEGRLPEPLVAALPVTGKHPLHQLLNDARLVTCGVLPADRVIAFHLARTRGGDVVLLHQLFGARGNITLVDRQHKLLWTLHRPPHTALASWPPPATWSGGTEGEPPPNFDALAMERLVDVCSEQAVTANRAAVNRHHKAAIRLVENLDRDLANADQGDLHRRKAEALAGNLHNLRQGAAVIVLSDLTDGSPLTITLDPAQTPAANMEAWFRRARKAKKGLEIIRKRHREATAQRARLMVADEELAVAAGDHAAPLARLAALQKWRADHPDLFARGSARPGVRTADEPARPFRRYLVDGVWEVWVGRNNRENDELTHRAAHSRDIWLHAQGVSGSHVILRTGGHPERVPPAVLAKAAALAALNSKARHAQHVPVIHTEKRYVRKPRKAPAGTAVCLRDQSLFVEPGVKAGVKPA